MPPFKFRITQPLCAALAAFGACFFIYAAHASGQSWQELKSEHFIVCFLEDERFAKDVLDEAEIYYQRIASELGYPRYSEFWTWDRRVRIYIHPDHASFLKATGQPQWSHGMADYKNKQIVSYAWSEGFLESLLPHEMAHLIFRDFVGIKSNIPLWLDEGVAQWAEEGKRSQIKAMAADAFRKNTLLSIHDMMTVDIKSIRGKDRVYIRSIRTRDGARGLLFLSGDNLISTYYLEAVSLVGFLIERYGSDSFAVFCRQLRDGKTFQDALRNAYPVSIGTLDELEEKWAEYMQEAD